MYTTSFNSSTYTAFSPRKSHNILSRTTNSSHMIRDQTLVIARPIVDGISIIRRLARAQIITILPEEICADARRVEGCLLPRTLHAAVVRGDAVFFQKAGLAGRFARRAVRADPSVTPVVGSAPLIFVSLDVDGNERTEGGRCVQLSGYKWRVPKSIVSIPRFLVKFRPSANW